jgi:rRNA-processing protein FCF1
MCLRLNGTVDVRLFFSLLLNKILVTCLNNKEKNESSAIQHYTECPISSRTQENYVIWQNTKKYRGKVIENRVFSLSGVAVFTQDKPLLRYARHIISCKTL